MRSCRWPGTILSRIASHHLYVFKRIIALATLMTCHVAAAQEVSFNQHIRPVLSDRCFICHGPDKEERSSDLRLDQSSGIERVIVPGDPDASELIRRLEADDVDQRMPPPHSKLTVTEEEIHLIRKWIQAGGQWESHWAFAPIPEIRLPPVGDTRTTHPIDRLLMVKLNQSGYGISDKASPENRLRRVTFDLTGVSPTLAELDEFLADPSDAAYERAVDRLLASPRFGERMASIWLDLARYSDTYGYQVDRERFVWPWRDWVVRAYNSNLPFDRFAIEQLAGDLLPNPTQDQILATTFNRLHPQKVEGGSIEEEFRVEYVADRVHAFGAVFLGLTVECARCHDHKFDPISMDEYYQLFAFFNNIDEAGLYSFFDPEAVPTPNLSLIDDQAKLRLEELSAELVVAEEAVTNEAAALDARFTAWLSDLSSRKASFERDQEKLGAKLNVMLDSLGPNQLLAAADGSRSIKLTGDDEIPVDGGRFDRDQPFSVFARIKIPNSETPLERNVIFHCSRAWTDSASRGYQVLIEEGKLSAALIHFWSGDAICVRTRQRLDTDRWLDIALGYDGSSRARGIRLFVDGKPQEVEIVRDALTRTILGQGTDQLKIGARFRDRGFKDGELAAFDFSPVELSELEIIQRHQPERFSSLCDRPVADLQDDELKLLREYYATRVDQVLMAARGRLQEARRAHNQFCDKLPSIMVMKELPTLRKSYRLARGAYHAREQEVFPQTPAVLPRLAVEPGRTPNRLDLARWLTSAENPLTARVAVNQFWQMLFGWGIVRTPEDFGSQSAPPLQLELLNWLARDFQQDWDMKRCIKQMVLSSAYQQTTAASAELQERDPENLWFGRQTLNRLSAEMVRDHVLLQSGLLVETLGGPPVRPYDLELAFSPLPRDQGQALYRRSLYTYWKRTSTSPAMVVLDAPSRDVCTMKRDRTSSPLQGLLILNGTQFVEAARKLSERALVQHGSDPQQITRELFRSLTSRAPTGDEIAILIDLQAKQKQRFANRPELAHELITVGESSPCELDEVDLAAWATVASVIMNLEESLYRR
jgi:hypothetical protein